MFMYNPVELHGFLHMVGITILYYDHFITFPSEYGRFWKHPKRPSSFTFFLNRYLSFFGDIVVTFIDFNSFPNKTSCSNAELARQVLIVVVQVVVGVVLILRTFAMYNRDKRILALILVVVAGVVSLAGWSVTGQSQEISITGGCLTYTSSQTAIRIAIAWEGMFVFDFLIFTLTLYKTYRTRVGFDFGLNGRRTGIITLMFRDGAIYFAVMACCCLANVVTFYVLQPALRGGLSTFASSVSVTMMSRLLLNLHQAASGTGSFDTTAVPLSSNMDTETLLFSTQIFQHPETTVTTNKPIESTHLHTDNTLESENITEIREMHTMSNRVVV